MRAAEPRPNANIDPRLLSEALRRARQRPANAGRDCNELSSAILAEAARGARDLYTLVRACERSVA
jgi:hypothetical protein